MTGFEAYKMCHALKLHFSSKSYDYFKYKGETNVTRAGYQKRKEDPELYTLVSTKYNGNLMEYFVANIVNGDKNAGVFGVGGDERYLQWKESIQNITYNYTNQIRDLIDRVNHFDDLFKIVDGRNSILLTAYYQGDVSIETFIILNQILNFFPQFSRELSDEYRWPDEERKCVKYEKFLDIDIQKYTTILKNTLNI